MSEILGNNPKIQNDCPTKRDYSADVTKYENHYQNEYELLIKE